MAGGGRITSDKNPMQSGMQVSKQQLMASVCKDRFYYFLKEFWDVFIPEKPVWNWHIEYLCNELQKVAERIFKKQTKEYDLLVNIPPGTTKSSICSVAFPAWVWTRMPTFRSLCGSYADNLALDLSRKSRDIIKSDKYQECFPDIELRKDQDTKTNFMNTAGGQRYAVGTGGTITGFHGHALIIDDPLDPKKSASELELKAANEWMDETLSQRKVDKSVTPLILIMQRLHQNDPSGARLSKRGGAAVKHICLPAKLTEHVNPPALRKYYVRNLLDPIRLNRKVLKFAKSELGEFGFAGQMLQHPVPRGGGMFKVERIKIVDVVHLKMKRVVRFWDKAGTSKGGAFTVGVKMGVAEDDTYWILDVVRGQWEASRRENQIRQMAAIDGTKVKVGLEQEPGSAGKESAENTIKSLAGFRAEAYRATGDKEMRADTFATQVNAGNVFCKAAPWNAEYIEELRYFPRSTFKDQVDSSSGAFSMLSKARIVVGAL